jgi:hypothetical protein
VVNVTVDQSTNLVVNPASLSIPANGAESFKVKLAKAPTAPVTVTVTPSTPDLTTTPASLTFTLANFNINQTVFVSTGLNAVPGAQSVLLKAGPLGQFKLPVTITPASKTIFFIDPTPTGLGNDNSPGTAALPWKTVANALKATETTGLKVATVASLGNDVVVTILGGANTENVGAPINTPALSAGSVTVLQAPSAGTFELNMGVNQLTLNKGYRLQDIKINSSAAGTAVQINHPTAGLASVEVECTGSGVKCVKVVGAGSHTLRDVTVGVKDNAAANIGIRSEANADLTIVGGEVRLIASGSNSSITLIDSQGVLTVTGLTVDMTGGASPTGDNQGIVLNAPGSLVTGSTIRVNNGSSSAKGIIVQTSASKSTVKGNTFIGSGNNSVAITGGSNLFSGVTGALVNNNFSGSFASPSVQP